MPDSSLQWPLSPVPARTSAATLSLLVMIHGPANHLFIRLQNPGHPVGTSMAKAISPAGDQCPQPPPCQLLPPLPPGLSTRP
jgi:hypothetical protein